MIRSMWFVAGLAVVAGCGGGRSVPGVAPGPEPSATEPTGVDTIFVLDVGDYVYPRLSPSGRLLAVAEVLREPEFENTQVLVANLRTGRVDTLFPADSARPLGVYASYVGDLSWASDDELRATILDGDVNGTALAFDIPSGRELNREFIEAGADALPANLQAIADRLEILYPEIRAPEGMDRSVFEIAMDANPIVIDGVGVIVQKNYAGYDHDIWYYGTTVPESRRLLPVAEGNTHSFGGGVARGGRVIFALTEDETARLYLYDGGEARPVAAVTSGLQAARVSVRHRNAAAWFLLRTHAVREPAHNPAFRFGDVLEERSLTRPLSDFDVNPEAGVSAWTVWRDGRRVTIVTRIPLRSGLDADTP